MKKNMIRVLMVAMLAMCAYASLPVSNPPVSAYGPAPAPTPTMPTHN